MSRKVKYASISMFLGFMLTMCAQFRPVMGQTTPTQQQPSRKPLQVRPVSLAHLYWHFLVYQNHLDTKAAATTVGGRDGTGMRNLLQKQLGCSDADFAPIRTSSARLTAEVQALDAQAATIRAAGPSSTSFDQLHALTVQREADINAEISYLKQNLSPGRINALEAFLTKFFSPNNAVPLPPSSVGALGPAGVQK
jgi:hypothetical protein